ncbi:MAG: hypothetical protein RR009_05305 [Oscillospiraceae bacterium]
MKNAPPRWMKLDNAAKIYPAAKRKDWTAMFRVSADLTEEIDPAVLDKALSSTIARFPSFSLRLRRGVFWYYLEHIDGHPDIQKDVNNPCVRLNPSENKRFAFRVRYYNKRIAVEIIHVLADGTGGLCFLKTLVAEYLCLKYGAQIPRGDTILDCGTAASKEEYEDGYIGHARYFSQSRVGSTAYHITGTNETDGFNNITTGIIPIENILAKAKEKGVSLTEYLVAVMLLSIDKLQRSRCPNERKLRPVKVNIPVNLRRFFPSKTMRNFANYVTPGIEPKLGMYTLDETLKLVHHFMGLEVTEKMLNTKITTNVRSEQNPVFRVVPLFIKNAAMKIAFNLVGDRQSSTTLSNLGAVKLPAEMERYVTRLDFIIGPLSRNRVVCAAISYKDKLFLNITRAIEEPYFEHEFYTRLVKLGIPVKIESNQR